MSRWSHKNSQARGFPCILRPKTKAQGCRHCEDIACEFQKLRQVEVVLLGSLVEKQLAMAIEVKERRLGCEILEEMKLGEVMV